MFGLFYFMKKRMNAEKRIFLLNLGLALFAVVSVVLLVFFCFSSEEAMDTRLEKPDISLLSEGWEVANKPNVTLPYTATWNKDVPISFSTILPEEVTEGDAICFSTNHATQRVYIGNRLAYVFGGNASLPIGHISGNIRIIVPLSKGDGGQKLTITTTSHYSMEFTFNPVLLGDRGEIVRYILTRNIWRMVVVPVLLLIAGLVLALGIYHGLIAGDTHQTVTVYFAAFVASVGLWIFTSGDIFQFVSNDNATGSTLSYLALMAMPITFTGMAKHLFASYEKPLQVLEWIGYANLFLQVVLYFVNIVDPVQLRVLTHLIILVVMVLTMIASIHCCRQDAYQLILLLIMLVFIASAGASLITYYLDAGSGNDAKWLSFGLVVFSLGILGVLESKELAGAKEALQSMIYKNMAYTDALTGLSNRMALEKDVDDIVDHLAEGKKVVFVMCDLNRLKQTNDTFGHEAGDKMIQDAAGCIREAIPQEAHCYRLGGDEFGVLLSGSEITSWYLIDKIEEAMSKYNVDHEITLSMAMGCATATFSKSQEGFFKELYKKADDMMYEVKRKQHLERAQAKQL